MLLAYIKAFHIIAIIAWMAGLLYLPRLFVYHAQSKTGSEQSETFKVMERRLLRYITTPAMLASWALGLVSPFPVSSIGPRTDGSTLKLFLVLLLSAYHGALGEMDEGLCLGSEHAIGAFLPHCQRSPDPAHDPDRDPRRRPPVLEARQNYSARRSGSAINESHPIRDAVAALPFPQKRSGRPEWSRRCTFAFPPRQILPPSPKAALEMSRPSKSLNHPISVLE